MTNEQTPNNHSLSDKLAIARTHLANERTFLAYFRTSIVLLSSGIAMIRLDFFKKMHDLGSVLIVISPLIIVVGIYQFIKVKRKIRKMM